MTGADSQSTATSHSSGQQMTILKQTVMVTRRNFVTHFDEFDEHHTHDITIEEYLEYIEGLRLTHMPHKGSHWDKVLKWAEFFGLQISGYAKTVESILSEAEHAAKLIWTACRALLQVWLLRLGCELSLTLY